MCPLRCGHNRRDGDSNHQPHDCLLNRLFRRRSKKTSKLRVTGLCAGTSPLTGEFPAQRASNAENVSIWWCHHGLQISLIYLLRNSHFTSDYKTQENILYGILIMCLWSTFVLLYIRKWTAPNPREATQIFRPYVRVMLSSLSSRYNHRYALHLYNAYRFG